MAKKILLVLAIIIVLFAGINTAAALNSSVLDAIRGLPLGDQITFIANEIDKLKLKDVELEYCTKADILGTVDRWLNFSTDLNEQFLQVSGFLKPDNCGPCTGTQERLDYLTERKAEYDAAKSVCDQVRSELSN